MKNLLIGVSLIIIFYLLKNFFVADENIMAVSTAITGLILISAYLLAIFLKNAKLPKLTGYMILGVIIGPIGLNLLNYDILKQLHFLENMALAFIAITAGGELKISRMMQYKKSIFWLLFFQILVVFWGLLLLINFISPVTPFLSTLEANIIIGFSILFAGTALSTSPAVTIGIITEFEAKGKITDIVLSLTILKSLMLVLMFPVLIGIAKAYLLPDTDFNPSLISSLMIHIGQSIAIGLMIGLIIIAYLKYIKVERTIFLLGIAVIISELGSTLNFDILLISIVAGVLVENLSEQGETLIKTIEKSSLPLYILFFCFAGATLHLDTVIQASLLATILIVSRIVFLYLGNYIGALLAGEENVIRNYSWLGFIGQAGIALGLASIIEKSIPGEIGIKFKSILLATVVINELMGPVLFKLLLVKAKEIKKL